MRHRLLHIHLFTMVSQRLCSLRILEVFSVFCSLVVLATKNAESTCDPVVDLLFVLDTSSRVNSSERTEQENFVRSLLKDHSAPDGAMRTAVMTCGDTDVNSSSFNSSYTSLLHSLGQSHVAANGQKSRHCLESINFKFRTEARVAVSRIAVILRGSWSWEEAAVRQQSEIARQENTVLVVVAIGIKDFGSLSAMQTLSYNDATFFVVSSYKDLKFLAKNLSKGSCKPISLDLMSGSDSSSQTTKTPTVVQKACLQLSRLMFKRHVPGFGYTRQRCREDQTIDIDLCRCVTLTQTP